MKKEIFSDCLGRELKAGDLIAIGSHRDIFMIINYGAQYFLHPINFKNVNKSYAELTEDMLNNGTALFFDLNEIKDNIFKIFFWYEPIEEEEKQKRIVKQCRQKQREAYKKHIYKKKQKMETIKAKIQEYFAKKLLTTKK